MTLHLRRGERPGFIRCISEGLVRFTMQELMISDPAENRDAIMDKTIKFGIYPMQNGPVIADGATVGQSESERITIHHGTEPGFGDVIFLKASIG